MELTLVIAFIAGIVSFLSPCILPVIPGFLAYLAGSSAKQQASRKDIFLNSLFFVLGFSLIFAVLGVLLNSLLGNVAYEVQRWLARIGGVIIIIFGLYLAELISLPFLERTHTFAVTRQFPSRLATSFTFGLAFGAGWTPCVGAILGGILGLAATQPGSAFWLLLTYSLGLGIPFLLAGLFVSQATSIIQTHVQKVRYLTIAFGIVLIILGILAFTQQLSKFSSFEFINQWLLR